MDRFTNVCEATSQSLDFDSFIPTHRKGKKLLAEKKRRARINNCLMRIKDIVCNGEEEKETDLDKMEKAEILEKTLEVLTRVRHNLDSTRKMSSQSTQKAMAVRYASGFSSCADESIRYIQNSRLVPTEVKHQLQAHLRSIAHRMESRIQSEQCASYSNAYTASPSVVIAPPQIVPVSSTTAPHIPSSLSFVVDNGDGTARLQISPSKNIDFPISEVRNSYQHQPAEIFMSSSSSSQMDYKPSRLPSPIRSSTPVTYIEDNHKSDSPILTNSSQNRKDISTPFIPVGIVDLPHSQDHKENQPSDYLSSSNIPETSSEKFHHIPKDSQPIGSAFHKITPRHCKSASPKSQWIRKNESSSFSSSSPTVFSSSQYSPVSPSPSSPAHPSSSVIESPEHTVQHIYSYNGYEPYHHSVTMNHTPEMPVPGRSPSDTPQQQITPVKAVDLCVRSNESHNISPETMWRPW